MQRTLIDLNYSINYIVNYQATVIGTDCTTKRRNKVSTEVKCMHTK